MEQNIKKISDNTARIFFPEWRAILENIYGSEAPRYYWKTTTRTEDVEKLNKILMGLGLDPESKSFSTTRDIPSCYIFEITDKNLWMLAKIKYGI
jgi:hypothetical protein